MPWEFCLYPTVLWVSLLLLSGNHLVIYIDLQNLSHFPSCRLLLASRGSSRPHHSYGPVSKAKILSQESANILVNASWMKGEMQGGVDVREEGKACLLKAFSQLKLYVWGIFFSLFHVWLWGHSFEGVPQLGWRHIHPLSCSRSSLERWVLKNSLVSMGAQATSYSKMCAETSPAQKRFLPFLCLRSPLAWEVLWARSGILQKREQVGHWALGPCSIWAKTSCNTETV